MLISRFLIVCPCESVFVRQVLLYYLLPIRELIMPIANENESTSAYTYTKMRAHTYIHTYIQIELVLSFLARHSLLICCIYIPCTYPHIYTNTTHTMYMPVYIYKYYYIYVLRLLYMCPTTCGATATSLRLICSRSSSCM